jgi:tRNA A-37 threonylcarbamoyl transferase component Bud32
MPILTPEERVGSTMAGKYRLDRIVASGGMATVFAGTHAWTERAVAVKILNYEHARDPEVVRRFLQEARAAAQLKHPNVVDVLDMGQDDDGTVYLVLELLKGETLKARMRRGPLPPAEIGALILPIMRAVASAHAKAVVHRDLKPDNVFLAIDETGVTVPKLLDFGIAKVSQGDSSSTRTGMMVGTPQYMAPEQVRGDRDVGAAADVWSLGVVLHAAVCGRVPFEGDSTAVVLARVITERARPLLSVDPSAPPAIAAVVDRALQHEAALRFHDMSEMIAELEAALAGREATPLAEGPTVQTDLRSLRPTALSEPPVTPFAWGSPKPADAAAEAPRSRVGLIALGAVVIVGLVAVLAVALGGGGATHTAAPAITSTPLSPVASPVATPVVPVAPPVVPVVVAPIPPPMPAEPIALPPEAAPISPEVVAIEALPAPEAPVIAAPPSVESPTERALTEEPRERRPREPRRGTRGALILH